MKREKKSEEKENVKEPRHEHPLPGEISPGQARQNATALQQAEKDMADDVESVAHNKNDDLDEGESARLGENTDLV